MLLRNHPSPASGGQWQNVELVQKLIFDTSRSPAGERAVAGSRQVSFAPSAHRLKCRQGNGE
jgi:hypothetical protein